MELDRDGIVEQISRFAESHANMLDVILGAPDEALPALIESAAKRIALELQHGDTATAALMREYIGGGDPEFWTTPLGYAVYAVDGYGRPHVPRIQAAKILGVSRQRIGQLEQQGVLVGTDHGLTAASVRGRWVAGHHALDTGTQEG
jgi:hypothetical protein